jgi:hypothetical protein
MFNGWFEIGEKLLKNQTGRAKKFFSGSQDKVQLGLAQPRGFPQIEQGSLGFPGLGAS